MELSRQEYPAVLGALPPDEALDVLNDRVYLISKINTDIADWLQERRKIEEAYAAGLRKLARRPQHDGGALGIFQMPWQRIVSGAENLAQSHETLAKKIETDVESPLRQFATRNREMQSISGIQANLASVVKKIEKDKKSPAKAGEAGREWNSQAPFVFEQLQALDETRINHLRDVLTQFQTHEVDQVERNRSSAESCLNALLNIETADEIKTFAAKVSSGRGSLVRRPSSAAASSRPMSSGMGPPPTPPPPRLTQDRSTARFDPSPSQDRLPPVQEKTPHKSSLGGLKRFGTVIGRKKDKAPPVPSSSEKRKEKGRSFAHFRRGDSSRSFQDLESTGQDLTPVATQESRQRQPSFEPIPDETPTRETSMPGPTTNGTMYPRTPDLSERPLASDVVETPRAQFQPENPTHELSAIPASPEASRSSMASDPIGRAQQDASAGTEGEELTRNITIRDAPIPEDESEAQTAINNMANQLRMQAQTSGLNRVQGSVRGRRDVRNTMFVPGTSSMSGDLSGPGMGSGMIATGAAAVAGMGISDLASPIKRSGSSGAILDDHVSLSDANSIHSSHSLLGMAQHPELTETGLNASIIETVNTWFADGGSVSKSFVVGEVALAYNHADSTTSPESETIRLSNFQLLEKVAANPTFVTSTASPSAKGKEIEGLNSASQEAGTYSISLSSISRPQPTVALKYQLHIEPSHLSLYSPLLLTPAWQITENQASAIIIYALNPAFSTGSQAVILKNVVVSVSLDTSGEAAARPTSAMMAPMEGASFRKKHSAVVWRMPELELAAPTGGDDTAPPAQPKKLLVRFVTQGGMPKRGSVDVKFELHGRAASALGVQRLASAGSSSVDTAEETDPFADAEPVEKTKDVGAAATTAGATSDTWEDVPCKGQLVTGKYSAA